MAHGAAAVIIPAMQGLELSRRYFFDHGLPLLRRRYGEELCRRVAAGLLSGSGNTGGGSDVAGFDDEISRDHNWGPRFFLLLDPRDMGECGAEIQRFLDENLPEECCGFTLNRTSFPPNKCYVTTPRQNALDNTGFASAPASDLDWITIPEHRLFEYTCGTIYYEPSPLITPVRQGFTYFPDEVRLKRLGFAFFALMLGSNGFRTARRGNVVSTQMFIAWMMECMMRIMFLARGRYAPHRKWLYHAFRQLPGVPQSMPSRMEALAAHLDLATVESQVLDLFADVVEAVNALGLCEPFAVDFRRQYRFGALNHHAFAILGALEARLTGPLRGKPHEGPLDLWCANFMGLTTGMLKSVWDTGAARPA